jgi:predicted nucleic acid-binding protein
MAYLIDTNVISELQKGGKANSSVYKWFESVRGAECFLSVLVIGELHQGIERLRRRDEAQSVRLSNKLQILEQDYGDRILPITLRIAKRWAENNVPNPLPVIDGFLAATAQEYGLVLVTRNVKDVASSGVAVLNPFE